MSTTMETTTTAIMKKKMIGVQTWTTTRSCQSKNRTMMELRKSSILLPNNKRENQLFKRNLMFIGIVIATVIMNRCSFCSCTIFNKQPLFATKTKTTTTITLNNRRINRYRNNYDHYHNVKQLMLLPETIVKEASDAEAPVVVVHSTSTITTTTTRRSPSSKSSSASSFSKLLLIQHRISRGGAGGSIVDDDENDDEEDEIEEDVDNDEEEDFDDDDDLLMMLDADNDTGTTTTSGGGITDADFVEGNIIDRMKDSWNNKTPPITKLFLSCSFVCTMIGYFTNQNEYPTIFNMDWKYILTRGQMWRILTPFFNFGPLGLGYLMTCQFVWVYMSTIERMNYKKPYDFWYMILFGQVSMIIGYTVFQLNTKSLGHNLSTYLVYIWSRYHEGLEVNMFDMFQTRAELLPWFFLGQTYLLEGEVPLLDFLGIIFGHVYYHYYTVGMLHAPKQIQYWYNHGTDRIAKQLRELYKQVSTDFDADVQ